MKLILGVTGSIAAYKTFDITRALVKEGHEVKVVLTQGALEFVKPQTYRYLGASEVYLPTDDFNLTKLSRGQNVLHIELVKWADKLIIAPLSANTLSRLNLGITNDLLASIFIARGNLPTQLYPAMNTQMWNNEKTKKNIQEITNKTTALINPASGLLACGDIGEGKFPEVAAVVDIINTLNPGKNSGKKVIITAGATAAPLDPVRFLTNPSSGKMGISVAREFLAAGFEVSVLAGHQCTSEVNNLTLHPNFTLYRAPTTQKMRDHAVALFPNADLYISTGAIADIEFDVAAEKIKKESMTTALEYHQAADILKEILNLKKPTQKVVSFAAETQTTQEVFQEKMNRKPVDLMVGNKVANGLVGSDKVEGFQTENGNYFFVTTKEIQGPFALTKKEVGLKLVSWFEGK